MNNAARLENSRLLALLIGSSEADADRLLDARAALTFDSNDDIAVAIGGHIARLLSRTLSEVIVNSLAVRDVAVEIVVGRGLPRYRSATTYVAAVGRRVIIGSSAIQHAPEGVPPLGCLLAACYACAAAVARVAGGRLGLPVADEFVVDVDQLLGADIGLLEKEVDFREAYLAGAGAIGNGFVVGLGTLPFRGTLHVVDDDHVSAGNLQRCVLFDQAEVDQRKAEVLCREGRKRCPSVLFIPRTCRIQELPERRPGPWLRRIVVGVDSPRARRQLQAEFPREVFDASTTGAEEIVFHYNRQPNSGACLACVYRQSVQENARERHIAESLGVTLGEVRELQISERSALKICAKFPHLQPGAIKGSPYDTLFKALCSSSKLLTPEGAQVLTPFAFVSVLAGAMLALEFFRRVHRGHDGLFNEWRISPWNNPVMRRKQYLARSVECEICGNPVLGPLAGDMWDRALG